MEELYRDRWIVCTANDICIKGYYLPWGTKRIRYTAIRSVRRVALGSFSGRGRIWGTSNPRYWASLDPGRPRKNVGLILHVGGHIRPFITPDDPDAVVALIRERAPQVTVTEGGGPKLV